MIYLNNRKYIAFTLAEVLITLLIIGVVASLVIPNLYADFQEQMYSDAAKKAYATFSQTLSTMKSNYDTSNIGHDSTNGVVLRNDFCNVMSCLKKGTDDTIWGTTVYKAYKGSSLTTFPVWSGHSNRSTILNNGYYVFFWDGNSNCTSSPWGVGTLGANICSEMAVDINGSASPNMFGKDMYYFFIARINNDYSLVPMGSALTDTTSCVVNGGWVAGCTFKRVYSPDSMP
jgi:type II secretory pathway pseudopilin PulG